MRSFLGCLLLMIGLSRLAIAQQFYTPEQLTMMIESRQYPEQAPIEHYDKRYIEFEECKKVVDSIMAHYVKDKYPVETKIGRGHYEKTGWGNDGSITATCSDIMKDTLRITTKPYKKSSTASGQPQVQTGSGESKPLNKVPSNIAEIIKRKCTEKWPENFRMQKYCRDEEAKAWLEMN